MEGWFILEMFGHIRHVGFVTEVEAFGSKLGRIDALQADGSSVTVHFSAASIFRLTPTTEESAREMVKPYEYKPLATRKRCECCDVEYVEPGTILCRDCREAEIANDNTPQIQCEDELKEFE